MLAPSSSFMCQDLGSIAKCVSESSEFKLRGVRVTPYLQRSLVVKLCVRGEWEGSEGTGGERGKVRTR